MGRHGQHDVHGRAPRHDQRPPDDRGPVRRVAAAGQPGRALRCAGPAHQAAGARGSERRIPGAPHDRGRGACAARRRTHPSQLSRGGGCVPEHAQSGRLLGFALRDAGRARHPGCGTADHASGGSGGLTRERGGWGAPARYTADGEPVAGRGRGGGGGGAGAVGPGGVGRRAAPRWGAPRRSGRDQSVIRIVLPERIWRRTAIRSHGSTQISPGRSARRAPLKFSTTWPNSRTLLQAVDPTALTRVDRSPTKIDAPTGGASVGTAPSTRCWTEISASAGGAPSAYKISTPPSSRSGTSAPIPVTVVE